MRLAIPPVLQVALALLAMWGCKLLKPFPPFAFPGQGIVALVLAVVGIGIIAFAVGLFSQAKTTVDPRSPEKGAALVTRGVYGFTRNPMYLAMAFGLLGMAIWTGQYLNFLIVAAFVWFMTRYQIKPEEEFLRARYGEQFREYENRVRRWL